MNDLECLNLFSRQMFLEPGEEHTSSRNSFPINQEAVFIHPAVMPNGRHIKLLKTLLTSACERDCLYCPMRAGRDTRRATFSPDKFAKLFISLHERKIAEGIFISSGLIGGGIRTQDKLIATIELLRIKYQFKGYVHLKIMPGCEKSQVERAMQLSDRVSINLEAPNSKQLVKLAPHKEYDKELYQQLVWIDEIRKNSDPGNYWKGHFPSSVTQFVVGAVDETDNELLTSTYHLYKNINLKRVYYSAFRPASNTPFENNLPADQRRELRLYQASFLLRNYPFKPSDIVLDKGGNLPLDIDPKLAWANKNLLHHPIELNTASKYELLQIPGIGVAGAERIIINRRKQKFSDLSILKKFGLNLERIIPFVSVNGKRPPFQMNFFNFDVL